MKKYMEFTPDMFWKTLIRMIIVTLASSVFGTAFTAVVNRGGISSASGYEGFIAVFRWITIPAFLFFVIVNALFELRKLNRLENREPADRFAFVCRNLSASAVCCAVLGLPALFSFMILGIAGVIKNFLALIFVFAPQCSGYFLTKSIILGAVLSVAAYPLLALAILFKRIYRPKTR